MLPPFSERVWWPDCFPQCSLVRALRALVSPPRKGREAGDSYPAKVLVAIVRRSPSQEAAPLSRRTTTPFHNIPFPSSWAAMLVLRRHSQTTRPTCLAGLRGLDWKGGELATPMCHSSRRSNGEGGRVARTKGARLRKQITTGLRRSQPSRRVREGGEWWMSAERTHFICRPAGSASQGGKSDEKAPLRCQLVKLVFDS